MVAFGRVLAAIVFLSAAATPLTAGNSHVALVPWQVLEIGATVDAPLALYWIPASPDELRRSPLLSSHALTVFSARCVAMRVVRVNDRVRLASLGVETHASMVVLTDRAGNILGRVEAHGGELSLHDVTELVRAELDRREGDAEARLDRARRHAAEQESEAALAIYREVADERCLCPRQARDAKRALRKLAKR